jgi:hypothetical protein
MLGLPAGCHRSAASTELQRFDLGDGLLWVAAATLQLTGFFSSHEQPLVYEMRLQHVIRNAVSLDRLRLFDIAAVPPTAHRKI